MQAKLLAYAMFLLFLAGVGQASAQITDQQAAILATRFMPPAVSNLLAPPWNDPFIKEVADNALAQIQFHEHFQYLAFTMPGDSNQYVLLAWESVSYSGVYWRLLKSTDQGATYIVVQDAPQWFAPFDNWRLRLQDLNSDGVPEILLEQSDERLCVFAWRNGLITSITPLESSLPDADDPDWTAFRTSENLSIEDLDGDGVAEIVVPTFFNRERQEDGGYKSVPTTPTRIYKYNGTSYVLWKEFPWSDDDPFPVHVPDIAVCHPGTIPLSELSSPGNGDLQVFVGHPGAKNTVDDIDTGSFTCNGAPLSFKKRWANQKQPDTTSANWEWEGCPVKQTAAKGQGEWNPSPEDPYLPSPDGKTEYHFVAPYLEFRLSRSAVFPYLLQQAQAAFAKEPGRQTYFIEIPISGKMKNGKLAAVSALVCIKNTGNPAKAAAPAAPAQAKG